MEEVVRPDRDLCAAFQASETKTTLQLTPRELLLINVAVNAFALFKRDPSLAVTLMRLNSNTIEEWLKLDNRCTEVMNAAGRVVSDHEA